MAFDEQPVVRVTATADGLEPWVEQIPAVHQLIAEGLDLPPGVTLLVGENGSGKSTLVEAVAIAYGLSPEGGSTHGQHSTRASESGLDRALTLQRGLGRRGWGFFLRAETMHGWYTYLENNPGDRPDPAFHAMSHGESFIELLRARFTTPGLYCLDEPEAALSFSSTLVLLRTLHDLAASGSQVICATHSPVLASLPGAHLLEVGPWGLRQAAWDDLDLVRHWRAYLDAPQRYLRHTLADD